MQPSRLPKILVLPIVTAVYFIAATVGLSLAFTHSAVSPIWPPTGIALAAVLLFGWSVWPAIFIGAVLVNIYVGQVSLWCSLGIGVGNTLEALTGGYLVKRFTGTTTPLFRVNHVIKFVILAGLISTVVSASIGTVSLCLSHSANWSDFKYLWFTWWFGDFGGSIVVTPFVLSWNSNFKWNWKGLHCVELFGVFAILIGAALLIFDQFQLFPLGQYSLEYLMLPILMWTAIRFDQRIVTSALVVLLIIAVRSTVHGGGPFVAQNVNTSLLLLEAFLTTTTLMTLILSGVVSERKGIESALRNSHSSLQDMNEELKHFAFAASHDLREPLRVVSNYTGLLKKKYLDPCPQEAKTYVDYISNSAKQMVDLIDDLSSYTQAIGITRPSPKLIDARIVLEKTLLNLHIAIKDSAATVTIGALPLIKIEEAHLQQIFQNLLSNAIKYRGSENPSIKIASIRREHFWEFSVKDNGIGIPAEYTQHIFSLFKRLHSQSEYPGTGVGLAICSKIVQRYGGRIWVESLPGESSTFYFTLPQ